MCAAVDRRELVVVHGAGERHVPELAGPVRRRPHEHEWHRPFRPGQSRDPLARIRSGHPAHPQQVPPRERKLLAHGLDFFLRSPMEGRGRRLGNHGEPVRWDVEHPVRVLRDHPCGNDHPHRPLHRQIPELEPDAGAQILAPPLERNEIVKRHHHRDRGAQQRTIDPRSVEEVTAPRPVGFDDFVVLGGRLTQGLEQAACVPPDSAGVLARTAVECHLHLKLPPRWSTPWKAVAPRRPRGHCKRQRGSVSSARRGNSRCRRFTESGPTTRSFGSACPSSSRSQTARVA